MLTFDQPSHTYTLDGARLPSVTQVLDQLGSYAGIPEDVLARKAEIGDAVHLCTELYDRDELDTDSVPPEIAGYFAGWLRFREETGFTPILIEERVYSKTFRYAGTLDRTGTFSKMKGIKPDAQVMVDLKCTYKLMATVGPQTAAYVAALNEQNRSLVQIKRRFAVRLVNDGTYQLEELRDPTDLSVFLAATTLYHWKQRHAAKGART